jgi:RHS repeat-associated protein
VINHAYDWLNQLVLRTESYFDGSNEKSVFIHDDGQIVLRFHKEALGSIPIGNLGAADLANRYLWGPVVDQLFADEQIDWSDEDADGETLWALADHLNTVRDIANNSGTVVDHAEYSAFGKRLDAAAVDYLFGFTGKLFDKTTGLQNNLHRWYDPVVGRWLSEDPISFHAGDPNLYRYVGNQPTTFSDPDGLVGGWFDGWRPKPKPRPTPKFLPPTNPPQLPPKVIPPGWRIREMPPTQQYPDGYWKLEKPMKDGSWQPIDPSTGKPGTRPQTHVPNPPKCPPRLGPPPTPWWLRWGPPIWLFPDTGPDCFGNYSA